MSCAACARRPILRAELRVEEDRIDRAYWTFTRSARGKPPVLAVPDAYQKRAAITLELATLGPCDCPATPVATERRG